MENIRILHVIGKKPVGGVGTFLMNSYTKNPSYQFDIIESSNDLKGEFNEFFLKQNSKIYKFPIINTKNQLKYWRMCNSFYKNNANKYTIVHVHSPAICFPHLYFAKKYGIRVRIYHSHSTVFSDNKIKSIRNSFLLKSSLKFTTNLFACGDMAGREIFGNREFDIIPNGVNIEKFKFNKEDRSLLRKEYGWRNSFVIGCIGSLYHLKNQSFILDIANILREESIQFVLIGDGPDRELLEKRMHDLNLNNVTFMGRINKDINKFYNTFDLLLLPSKNEGFPMVAIEAQTNGLPVILSSNIDNTVGIQNNAFFLKINLENSAHIWAHKIIENMSIKNLNYRFYAYKRINSKGYSLEKSRSKLFEKYGNILHKIQMNGEI